MKYLKILVTSAALTAAVSSQAALTFYEGFDYSTGSLDAQSGGTGFTGAWSSDFEVTSPGLSTPGPLTETGNKATDVSGSPEAYRAFDTSGLATENNSLWFSFSFQTTSTGSDLRVHFFGDRNIANAYQTGVGVIAKGNGSFGVELSTAADGKDDSLFTYNTSNPHMVVGRLDFGDSEVFEDDTLYVWMDPEDFYNMPEISDADGFLTHDFAIDGSDLVMRGGGSFTGSVDELRFGTSYADVVPEPSIYAAIAGLAALALTFYRKRQ